jgi:methionyl-tRNA formyltransferase
MKLVFLGTGDIALPTLKYLLEAPGHEVAAVVTQPDRPAGRGNKMQAPRVKELALAAGVPVLQPEKVRRKEALEELRGFLPADLFVVMAYGQILPTALIEMPSIACVNLHASLLPRHRGASPVHAAVLAGDATSGITLMHIAQELDAGDMILSREIPLDPRETAGSLHDRLADLGPEVIAAGLAELAQGKAPRVPQDVALVTYAPKLDRDSGKLDWSQSAVALDRVARGLHPWPGVWTVYGGGTRLKVLETFPEVLPEPAEPGTVVRADVGGLWVACGAGDEALRLVQVQPEGRRAMQARDFANGTPGLVGSKLGSGSE